MGFILFIVALVILGLIGFISLVVTLIYYLVTLKWNSGATAINKYFYKLALSIDQFGNALCATPFNLILIKPVGFKFGDEDDTISFVLAMNKRLNSLTWLGRLIGNILDTIDNNHLEKAIEFKIEKDKEAAQRVKEVWKQ